MTDLLDTYRSLIANLGVATNPLHAIKRGLSVPRPNSAAEELAKNLLVKPAAVQLLVGGIGSGKTTELLLAQQRISQTADTKALYIDVSAHHDLRQLKPGVLLLLAGLYLSKELDETQRKQLHRQIEYFNNKASGYATENDGSDDDERWVWVAGELKPPGPNDTNVLNHMREMKYILEANQGRYAHHVIFFDSLDRVHDIKGLLSVVEEDVAALRGLGIGVVIVARLRTLYGPERIIVQKFDDYTFLWDIDVTQDDQGREFLRQVLHARAPKDVLPDEPCNRLIGASGGVLRDLIALTEAAAKRAYFTDSPQITSEHVETAAVVAGQKLLFGVDQEGKKNLDAMARGRSFVLATDKDLELLETRRVLQYQQQDGQPRFALNPLLLPLLPKSPFNPRGR